MQTGVITSPPGDLFSETNHNSAAILLTYGPRPSGRRRRGGKGVPGERSIHRSSNRPESYAPRLQHLWTPLFLSRFPPKIAVIQVGAENPYGHPTPEVLDRLQRTGARIFRNDEHGDVIVTLKEGKVEVAVTKPEAAF